MDFSAGHTLPAFGTFEEHDQLNFSAFMHNLLMFVAMMTDLISMDMHRPNHTGICVSSATGHRAVHVPWPIEAIVDPRGGILNWEPS